jgi:SAM-dependent methyltransferase
MEASQPTPSYGVIDHYLGAKGEDYFAWQGADGDAEIRYNMHLWQPHITPGDDVLDFGCGGGYLLAALTARRKVGVEVNPQARACARRLGVETVATLDEVSGTFDKVITSHALEHVPHPREAILGLKGRLRDAASRLLILLPLDDWRAKGQCRYTPNDVHMHLHAWTPQSLGNLLSTCDLRVEDVWVVRHAWPPGRRLLWKLHPTLFHAAARFWSAWNRQRQLFAVAALKG